MIETLNDISRQVGYDVIHYSNNQIKPLDSLDSNLQKVVIFDDFLTEKHDKPIIDYFIGGRHKNASILYLSQSYFKTSKTIRLNCSHYVVYDFPSNNEKNLISRELNVTKEQYEKSIEKPFSFLFVDKSRKIVKINFFGNI